MRTKLIAICSTFLALLSTDACMADDIRIDNLIMSLPAGYRHEPKSGEDTSVGLIHTTDPALIIKYDIGVLAGGRFGLTNMLKPDLAAVVYFEEISLGDLTAYFIAFRVGDSQKKRRLFLKIPAVGAHLSTDLDDPSVIAAAKAALVRIKYRKLSTQ